MRGDIENETTADPSGIEGLLLIYLYPQWIGSLIDQGFSYGAAQYNPDTRTRPPSIRSLLLLATAMMAFTRVVTPMQTVRD